MDDDDDDDDDDDEIPRPPSAKRCRYNDTDTGSQPATSRTASSSIVSSHAPNVDPALKALDVLEVVDGSLVRRPFSLIERRLPRPLVDLLTVVDSLASGTGVISPSAKDAITSHPRPLFGIDMDDRVYSAHRDTYGPTPSTEQVLDILEAASNCDLNWHDEDSWNTEVYHRVLETALRFRSSDQPSRNLFAQPVDFCLYIDPATVEGTERKDYITKTIDAVRSTIPDDHVCINHTDHLPLRRNPITVSIVIVGTETKRYNVVNAHLQIGVWQVAQWNFLRWMAQGDTDGDMPDETRDLGLEFLPGIVIMGHDWRLIATTNDSKRTLRKLEEQREEAEEKADGVIKKYEDWKEMRGEDELRLEIGDKAWEQQKKNYHHARLTLSHFTQERILSCLYDQLS
ncbi:hypothetical protein N0V85_006618 [Neurospora sp. IMI 360204]|nr:hypothetical protein N0V85_006618 [Neurospora sp. IMI 360204]